MDNPIPFRSPRPRFRRSDDDDDDDNDAGWKRITLERKGEGERKKEFREKKKGE